MKFYLKQAIVPFIYMIFVSIIALGILGIDNMVWLKAVLGVLNLILYSSLMIGISYKEGQQALKVRIANDVERKQMIKTGMDRPLKLHEEYKWWKGFLMGATACLPMVILMILHTVLILINPALVGFGVVASYVYMAIFIFFALKPSAAKNPSPISAGRYYFNFLAIPIVMLVYGIGYNLGARKIMQQQYLIKQKHRDIYGEEL